MAQVNLQRLLTSLMASAGSILVSFVVVFLYATFLLIERRTFDLILYLLKLDGRVASKDELLEFYRDSALVVVDEAYVVERCEPAPFQRWRDFVSQPRNSQATRQARSST